VAAVRFDDRAISDGVVALRAFSAADAPALARIWRDPAIRARNGVPAASEEAALAWVATTRERAAAGEAWEWAIVDVGSSTLAGRRALKRIDRERGRAEAASWVAPEFRGRRFAARSLWLAAGFGFSQGLRWVYARCEVDNEAALRGLRAAGMRYDGLQRDHAVSNRGERVDMHLFGLGPEQLAAARSS
jgi:RimJ/RimL family protein N-acetyltransferase